MSKQAWVSFTVVQLLGCIFASYGTEYTSSAFLRASWLIGFLLLLLGNIPALAVNEPLTHIRAAYVFFPVAVACNAMLWVIVAAVCGRLRRITPNSSHIYATALAATGLLFVIVNTLTSQPT
jgi:putative exporter of polyketide antibiotics